MERDEHELTGTQTRTPKAQSWSMVTRKSNESYSQSKKAEGSQAEGGQAEASRAEASQAEGSQAEGSRKIKADFHSGGLPDSSGNSGTERYVSRGSSSQSDSEELILPLNIFSKEKVKKKEKGKQKKHKKESKSKHEDLAAGLSISIPPLRTFETTPLYIREQPSTFTYSHSVGLPDSLGDSGKESCVSSFSSSWSDSSSLVLDRSSSSQSDSEGLILPLDNFSKEKVKKKEKEKQKKHKKESKSKYAESSDTSEHRSSISNSSMGDELRMLRRELREEEQKLREEEQKLREEEQKLREEKQKLHEEEQKLREKKQKLREEKQKLHEEKQKLREEELQKLNRKARDLAAGLSINIPPSRRSETTSLREQPATYSKLDLDENPIEDLSVLSLGDMPRVMPGVPSSQPKLTQEKCIKPDDILFYLMDKSIDVEMVRFGKTRESFEIFMNRDQWAGIKEELHRKFQHVPPYDIVLLPSDACGVVTELSGYTDSGVSVSIGRERTNGKVSLILLKSEQQPCMLMMAHVLRDLNGLKSRLPDAIWEKMWSLKSIHFEKDDYKAVIDELNMLLDKKDLKIELNYPEQQANQQNKQDTIKIFGTKIVGLAHDTVANETAYGWDELRNKLPPNSEPRAFLACDAALIELRIDDSGSTAATKQLKDFSRICIANDELRRISNIFEVLDLTDETWENIAKKSLFCDGLKLKVQWPPRSEARRAQGFGTHSMCKPKLIAEPEDGNPCRLLSDEARGNSGMMSVKGNDEEIDESVSSLGALHSVDERLRQLYFIPIWHQFRAMKYLPEYELRNTDYYLINQPAAIPFNPSILEAPKLASDDRPPAEDIDESKSNPSI